LFDRFVEVSSCVALTIPQEEDQARAIKLLHKAQGLCLVSRALAIQQTFKSVVKVASHTSGSR
jgi:organic hydroperoxide reductase OsmC/OhrA